MRKLFFNSRGLRAGWRLLIFLIDAIGARTFHLSSTDIWRANGVTLGLGLLAKRPAARQHREQSLQLCVIPECAADVDEQIAIPRSEDEAGSKLEGILSERVLAVSGALSAASRFLVFAAEKMEQVCRFQFGGVVGDAVGIDQQRERDARLFTKQAGVVQIAQSDRGQRGSGLFDFRLVLAQLRDMLAAEDSAVVPQKNNDGWVLFPQRAEADIRAACLGQHDV